MDDIRSTEWLLLMASMAHLIVAPFTKVEESFNTQALHDLLFHGTNLSAYDHLDFPGVVPRTFVGPLALASVLYPIMPVWKWLACEKYWMLMIGRFALGAFVLYALCAFCRAVARRFNSREMGDALRLITATQFHFIYYSSRPLPNTFALIPVLLSYERVLNGRYNAATVLATTTVVLFRSELVLLYGPLYLVLFATKAVPVVRTLAIGIATALVALLLTVPLDSYFWQEWPLWPEGKVLYFNVWQGRSGEYGTSPYWWYFTSALPRALSASALLIPFGFMVNQRGRRLLAGMMAVGVVFVLAYSLLPHKELRFVLYAVPLMNVPAARFMAHVYTLRKKSIWRRLFFLAVSAHLLVNLLTSAFFLFASARNYPGGEALLHLQHQHRFLRNRPIAVHIDTYCAVSGVSRFLHLYDPQWKYDKTEGELSSAELQRFDYLLVGSGSEKELRAMVERNFSSTHEMHFGVDGFYRVEWARWKGNWVRLDWLGSGWKGKELPVHYPRLTFQRKVVVMKRRVEE